jgi:hypothetical protein
VRGGTERTGIVTGECPVRVLGRAAGSGARIWFVYEVGRSSEMWLLSPGAHDYFAILDLFAARQDWARRRWPPPKGSLRAFDAKQAAAELMAAAPQMGVPTPAVSTAGAAAASSRQAVRSSRWASPASAAAAWSPPAGTTPPTAPASTTPRLPPTACM